MHFTYVDPDSKNKTLKQGDILQKTPELIQLLNKVHPHYSGQEYKFFQVITQSCDLVRRGERCKSRYITLAAVRTLDDIIDRFINDNASPVTVESDLYCSDKEKSKVLEFLKKLFNNNEKEYFFLQSSPAHGLYQHHCTLLYLSIAIRAYEHYELCLNSKCLELTDNFQSKLGWMVGNLYSRVGTEDYVPTAIPTKREFDAILEKIVNDHIVWVPQVRYPELKKIASHYDTIDEINTVIEEKLREKKESKATSIVKQLKEAVKFSDEDEKKLKNIIMNGPIFQKIIS